jgi:adenylate cyclase
MIFRLLRTERMIRISLVFLACCMAIFLEWQRPELLTRFDEGLRDVFLRWNADTTTETRLTLIDINEEAIAEIGSWPWSREKIADLVEILLATYHARGVGLDIVFPEPSDSAGDERLASLAAHAPLTLAQIFDYAPRSQGIALGKLAGGHPASSFDPAISAHGFIANHRGLENAACVGNIGYLPDNDGVLRRMPMLTRFQNRNYANFAATILDCSVTASKNSKVVPSAGGQGYWRIPYRRALSAYTVIPASAILLESAPIELLAGRYVLVGSSALSLGDRVSIPLAPLSAGVMVHAYSLSALLDQADRPENAFHPGAYLPILWVLISSILAALCLTHLSVWANLLLLPCLAVSWLLVAIWGVSAHAEWSVSSPLWVFSLFILAVTHQEWRASRHKALKLIETFSHYVAQPVLNEIIRTGLNHSLIPTLREVTVLIADMEGYTRTTSALSLEDAAQLTKDFLDCLTRPVLQHGGTLDKYSGDGLVAFWGAPLPCPEQADHAVSAGLDILREVKQFNEERMQHNFLPVRVRIGIESGQALVGDLGTPFRSTYTAVGDCINFASRLEAAARDLPTQLVIGAAANAKLEIHKTFSLGTIALRDTQMYIEVFTIEELIG